MNSSIDNSSTSRVTGFFEILGKSFNLSAEVGDDIATKFVADLGELDMPTIAGWLISLFKPGATFVQFPPPWDFLNKITFEGLKVVIEGKNNQGIGENKVGFSYDISLDYGFVVIDALTINYNVDQGNVEISLEGQLLGLEIPSWDIYPENEAPPVPGYGDEYFNLIFFGMGQRLSIDDGGNIESVGEAITELKGAFEEPTPIFEPGGLVFNPNSNWLIGTQFIVINTVDLSVIFNDPKIYGIRLALSGDKAQSFAGLEVEILYRQVTDNIGVFQLELKLPDAMRQFDIGAVSFTLPVVGIAVYTNGNFRIDFGFPYDADFSRSFTVQAFPFIGAGGFYFALLTGETSPRLPANYNPTTGSFNPVIDFGLGLRLGFGKEINKGILKAGISITVQGIVMGTLAFFNPDKSTYPSKKDDLYYWLNGQFLIVGRLYGTVEFSIISASFDLTVYVSLGVTIESYQPIILHLEAGVKINLKVRIKLGFFKVTIKLSFEFTVSYTFELPAIEKGVPQWALAEGTSVGSVASRYRRKFRSIRMPRRNLSIKMINWQPVAPQAYVKEPLTVYFLPQLSVADPSIDQGTSSGQQAVFISMLFLKSAAEGVNLHQLAPEEYAFERLAQALFIWVVSSYQQTTWASCTLAQFLAEESVSYEDLAEVFDYLSASDTPISYLEIQAFLDEYFDISLTSAQDPAIKELSQNEEDFNVSLFPMFPDLQMRVSLDETLIYTADFSTETMVGEAYHKVLTAYFSELAARYQTKIEKQNDSPAEKSCQPSDIEQSLATFIFQDFFLLQARNSVQSAMDLLDSYPIAVTAVDSLEHLTELYDNLVEDNPTKDILETNQTIPLEENKRLFITGLSYPVQNGDTFFSIAANYFIAAPDSFYTALATYEENDQIKGIFIEGKVIFIRPNEPYVVENGDSLASIAEKKSHEEETVTPADLVILNATVPDILNPFILLAIPPFDYYTQPGDDISGIVNKLQVSLENLGTANQENEAVIFPLDTEIILPHLPGLSMDLILEGLIKNNTFSNQAGMTSRNLMAGIRPPKPDEETLWKGPAVWSVDNPGTAGLYELTGQQFVLPELESNSNYVILLEKNDEPTGWAGESQRRHTWYQLSCEKAPGIKTSSVEIILSGLDIEEVHALQDSKLDPEIESLTKPLLYTKNAQGFSLGSSTVWQTNRPVFVQGPSGVTWPSGPKGLTGPPDTPRPWGGTGLTGGTGPAGWVEVTEPIVWYFSDEFKETLAQKKRVLPKFQLAIDKRTPLNPLIENQEVNAFGWASICKLEISLVPSTVNSPNHVPFTYFIDGTDEDGIKLLEQLIINQNQPGLPQDERVDIGQIHFLYSPNPTDQNDEGFRSDGIAQTETFIVKTNLSTQSHPDLSGGLSLQSSLWEENWVENNLLNSLELIWEASIVRSGGYFLYYRNLATNAGFPDSMFDDSGKATIQVVITYGIKEQLLPAFVNCAVLGDKVEENALLVAESLPQCIRDYEPTASLEQIMLDYNVSLGELAERVRVLPINASQPALEVKGIVFQLDSNDWTLDSIAEYFDVSPAAIEALNPNVDFDDLKTTMAIKIPTIEYPVDSGTVTFNLIAQTYGVTVASLVYYNRERQNLFVEGAKIDFNNELIKKSSTIPSGNVAFKLTRKNPEFVDFPVDEAGEDPQLSLELNYNLLGYGIEENQSFGASVNGLPISPEGATGATPSDPCGPTGNLAPQEAMGTTGAEDPYWDYRRVVPAFPYAKMPDIEKGPQFPEAELNPYLGTGEIVQINLDWVDSYGNKTVNPFNNPDEFPQNKILNNFPILTGYTDEVIGVDKWPATSSSYIFLTDPELGPIVELDLNFDISKYAPVLKENETADELEEAIKVAKEGAAADLQTFKTVYYQMESEDMEVRLRSSTDEANITKGAIIKEPLQLFIQHVCHFLQAISSGNYDYTFHQRTIGETLEEIATYYEVDLSLLMAFNPGANDDENTGEEGEAILSIPDFNCKLYPTDGIETFEEIAQKFKITKEELATYNPNVSDPPPDSELLLVPNFKFINYTTRADDTLACIAEKFEIGVDAIEAMNPGTPKSPPAGTLLVLPDFLYEIYVTKAGDTLEEVAAAFEVPYQVLRGMPPQLQSSPTEGSPLVIPSYDYKTYTTQAGDTLAKIAADNRVLLSVLERINPKVDFDPPVNTIVIIPKEPLNQAVVLPSTFSPDNEAIFQLTVQLSFQRLNHIDDQFLDEPSVQTAHTFIRPIVLSPDDCTLHETGESESSESGLSLLCFAKSFEDTFEDTKIAITHSPLSSKSEKEIREVWVIRLAEAAAGPVAVDNVIDFEIKTDDGTGGENNVHFFAPIPLSGYPLSGKFVIQDYARGIGLTGAHEVSYSNVKLDVWGQDLLAAVDQFLEADYVTPAFILDQQFRTSYVNSILDSKEKIATAYRALVQEIILTEGEEAGIENDTNANLEAARDILEQEMLVKLSSAFSLEAIVQLYAEVQSPFDGANPPQLFGSPQGVKMTSHAISGIIEEEEEAEFTLSTSRIPLPKSGNSNLSFLFSTKRVQDNKTISLKLDYGLTAIEFDIKEVDGIEGYKASTWLYFVNPPEAREIGVVDIPLLFKAYPTPPSLVEQRAESIPLAETLAETRMWQYSYGYQQVEAAQDIIHTNIRFNVSQSELELKTLDEPPPDLFEALAEFMNTYPGVQQDFVSFLVEINENSTGNQLNIARIAVQTFAKIIASAAEAWPHWLEVREQKYKLHLSSPYDSEFSITEPFFNLGDKGVIRAEQEYLLAEPSDYFWVEVEGIDLSGDVDFPYIKITDAITTTIAPSLPRGEEEENTINEIIRYYFLDIEGQYLTLEEVRDRHVRLIVFGYHEDQAISSNLSLSAETGNLDVMEKQNAWGGVSIRRNQYLFDNPDGSPDKEKPTNPNFIYQTATIRFSNLITPLLESRIAFNIAEFPVPANTAQKNASYERSLIEHLQALFYNYFGGIEAIKNRKIKLNLTYTYHLQDPTPLSTGLNPLKINVPAHFVPPFEFNIPQDWEYEGPSGSCQELDGDVSFICILDEKIRAWYKLHQPPGAAQGARFIFEISTFSTFSDSQLPVYKLSDLYLKLEDIVPPV